MHIRLIEELDLNEQKVSGDMELLKIFIKIFRLIKRFIYE
jgi:hypothetical protein